MTSDPATEPAPRLRAGDRLGSQSIRGFRGSDAFGERYETVFGSTAHVLDACVPAEGASSPTVADYRAFAARAAGIRHPCLVRYFSAGESVPRPGADPVPWLRGEHAGGASAAILDTPVDPDCLPADEDGPRVSTLGELFASCGGRLSPKDRDAFLGDVLDGLVHLHSHGLPCGHFRPDDVSLDRVRHRAQPIARLRVYAWPPDAEPADLSADLILAAPLFRAALDASLAVSKPREADAFAAFADKLGTGGFERAEDAADAFADLCGKWGRPRPVRLLPGEDAADSAPAPRNGGDDGRHGRLPSSGRGSEVSRRLMALLRIFLVVAFIVGVGVAVYFYLSAEAERARRRVAALSGETLPAITVIPTERSAADRLAEVSGGVFDCTAEQLALLADASDDPRSAAATVRLAFESLDAAAAEGGVSPAAFSDAAARIRPFLPALRAAAEDDPGSALLLGRAKLLGLGLPRDVSGGYRLVQNASVDGLHEADLVFGDLLAGDVPLPDLRAESRVERDRRAVAAWRRAAGPDKSPGPLVWRAADRIAPMLRSGRGVPPMNNDYPRWLGRLAAAGHVPSLFALSTPGGFASDDPAEALKWLRILARSPSAAPSLRAWAQYRMAVMFERGEGTPPSAAAARKWLERAAEGGCREAMLELAGKPDAGTDAAAWRERAETAEPVATPVLRTVLVSPPSGVSKPAKSGPDAKTGPSKPAKPGAAKPAKPGIAKPAKPGIAKPAKPGIAKPVVPGPKHKKKNPVKRPLP